MTDDIPDWVNKPPLTPTEQMRAYGGGGSPSDILSPPQRYDFFPDYQRVKQLRDALPWNDEEHCKQHTIRTLRDIVKRTAMPHAILYELHETIHEIFEQDFYKPYLLDWYPTMPRRYVQEKEEQYRHYQKRIDAATEALIGFFVGLLQNAPPSTFIDIPEGSVPITVPFARMYTRIRDALAILLGTFFSTKDPTDDSEYLFYSLHKKLFENLCQASGYSADLIENGTIKNPKIINPANSDLPPIELCRAYLRDTPFLPIFEEDLPFELPQETRFGGHWIIAPPGRGKTTLLHSMVLDDLSRDASIIIMDSKGELIEPIKKLKAIQDRLILIEPDTDNPVAINPLDIPNAKITTAVDLLEYVFSSLLEFKMTPLQTILFRNVFRALVSKFPNPTLETFRDLLTNGYEEKYLSYIQQLPADVQDFFYNEFNDKLYVDRRKEVIQRLRLLLDNDAIKGMLLATRTRFNVGEAMDAGKIIIVNNSKELLGKYGSEFFSRFFLALILAAAQSRSRRSANEKKPCYVYLDECHTIIQRDETIPTMIDECRSQKIALILSHQRCNQLDDKVLDAVSNCAIRFGNSDEDAKFLAPRLRTESEFLQSMPRGTFAAFVRDLTPHALALKVPYHDLSKLPQMTAAEQLAIRDRMREQFSFRPEPPLATPQPQQPSPPLHQPTRAPASTGASRPSPRPPERSPLTPASPTAPRPQIADPDAGAHTQPATKWDD